MEQDGDTIVKGYKIGVRKEEEVLLHSMVTTVMKSEYLKITKIIHFNCSLT